MVLEDQALVRAGMRALIEISAPEAVIAEASSSEEALSRLASAPIDIAFVDIELRSGGSGLDVLRHVGTAQLPTRVIMLSAHDEEAMVLECLRLGASGYIVKDMEAEGLFRRALDTVFAGGIFLPGTVTKRATPDAPAGLMDSVAELDQMGVRGRTREALYYVCQGFSNQLIARKMGIVESTVANEYNSKLFQLFRVTSRASLIVEVSRRGLRIPQPARARPRNTSD
jgi:two-component system nitrate/nitrite response regulator NarL